MTKTALLVVDVQEALVGGHPYREAEFISSISRLLKTARQNKIEVIYVRHDGGAGDELEANTLGWNVYRAVAPEPAEKIFDKKFNSAFKDTGLKDYLNEKGIRNLILVGMQTEYCIDATCKAAFEYGYTVTIPTGATTTFDNEFLPGAATVNYYERKIWNRRFAEVLSVEKIIGRMKRQQLKDNGRVIENRNCRIHSLYLCVKDMNRAIRFYEQFFEQPVSVRDTVYSVFNIGGFRLGLFAYREMNEQHTFGSNCLPSIEVENIHVLKSKLVNLKIIFPLTQIGANWVAEFEDSEGNPIEITAPVSVI